MSIKEQSVVLTERTDEEINLLEKSLNELEFQIVLNQIAKKCYSELGKELINKSRPEQDLYWLQKEHDYTEEYIKVLTEDDTAPFESVSDVRPILYKSLVKNSVLSTGELLEISETIRTARLLKNYFLARGEKYSTILEEISLIHTNRLLEKHIDEAIDETGEVRDTASKELSRIRKDILNKSNHLRSRLNQILKRVSEQDMTQEDFVTMREGRFVLPLKSEHKRHIPGIIHGLSQTGSTVFLEPSEIIEINNDLSLLLNEEKREIYKILSNLTAELGDEANEFLRTIEIIAHYDSIQAKANYALEFGGIKPKIIDESRVYLNGVRHPLLVHSKGRKNVIPLNIEFSEKVRGHLISGPNAGGKTVSLKSIGLSVAMALSGIYPLGECHTNFRMIYTSIGDHQSIEHDLSTFSSQIIQMKDILSAAFSDSLILIDEIGSGTDPHEGSALSAGILDTLIELKSFFVATTHNSALKSYAFAREVIRNASLEFDEQKLKPTYKFLEGVPGNSYAFQLAKNLGLSDLVLERAKTYLGKKQSELEDSIALLHKYKNEAEKLKLEAAKEKKLAEDKRKKYEEKFLDIKMKRDSLVNKANEEAREILNNANAVIEKTIKEIKEQSKKTSEIKESFNVEKQKIENKIQSTKSKSDRKKQDEVPVTGDYVTTHESDSPGVIMSIDSNKIALVDFNGIKFKLPLEQLVKTAKKAEKSHSTSDFVRFDTKSSTDIRGMRAFEAIPLVDELINNALMYNLEQVTIIHGKGTGALRYAIHEFLNNHHAIKSYRNGTLIEGGDGVTVVEI